MLFMLKIQLYKATKFIWITEKHLDDSINGSVCRKGVNCI